MATIGGANIVESGLVLNLDAANVRSYPRTGTIWNDLSGNGYNTTLVNGPIFNSADNGSIVFDGTNDYVNLGPGYFVSTNAAFTVNVWFNINKRNDFQRIVTLDALNTGGLGIAYREGSSNGYTGLYVTSAAGWIRGSTGRQLTSNVWRMLTYIYNGNGSTTTSNFSMFLNAEALNLTSTGSETVSAATPNNLLAGRLISDPSQSYPGKIATASIYNRALSASEISQNFNATKARYGL